jgi:hypothetical protein
VIFDVFLDLVDIGVVQSGIDFVEDKERAGLVAMDGE